MELSKEQVALLTEISNRGSVLRIFLSSAEIKNANILVKQEYLEKGINDMKNGTTIFFISRKGEDYLFLLKNQL